MKVPTITLKEKMVGYFMDSAVSFLQSATKDGDDEQQNSNEWYYAAANVFFFLATRLANVKDKAGFSITYHTERIKETAKNFSYYEAEMVCYHISEVEKNYFQYDDYPAYIKVFVVKLFSALCICALYPIDSSEDNLMKIITEDYPDILKRIEFDNKEA